MYFRRHTALAVHLDNYQPVRCRLFAVVIFSCQPAYFHARSHAHAIAAELAHSGHVD